jgi:tetratricopeptide (TPR) repeat protein
VYLNAYGLSPEKITMISLQTLETLLKHSVPRVAETGVNLSPPIEQVKTGISALFLLLLLPLVIALFFILRFIYRHTVGEKLKTTLLEDYKKEAEGFEKAGKYVSAANVYESKLRDRKRAAALYEKGGDHRKAASLYDLLGESAKAKEMYEKGGNIEDSAEVSMRDGEFEDAAKLYDKAGKKHDAALLMERAGRRLAAVRAYREAGDYSNAARLLEIEGMAKEAAEMFGLSLRNKQPDAATMQDFYTYAFKLEKAGLPEEALEVYREIDKADPTYKDVRERLQALSPSEEKEEDLGGRTTIRSFIKSGSMDPKNSLKLWLHILRGLQEAYNTGRPYGLLAPDNIAVDSRNSITFLNRTPSSAYVAPEKSKGIGPDATADVYSMGVILFEMLTGSLEGLGSTRVSTLVHDLPDWLDELVIRCIRKVREDRYQGIDEIFTDIKALSKGKKDQTGPA